MRSIVVVCTKGQQNIHNMTYRAHLYFQHLLLFDKLTVPPLQILLFYYINYLCLLYNTPHYLYLLSDEADAAPLAADVPPMEVPFAL